MSPLQASGVVLSATLIGLPVLPVAAASPAIDAMPGAARPVTELALPRVSTHVVPRVTVHYANTNCPPGADSATTRPHLLLTTPKGLPKRISFELTTLAPGESEWSEPRTVFDARSWRGRLAGEPGGGVPIWRQNVREPGTWSLRYRVVTDAPHGSGPQDPAAGDESAWSDRIRVKVSRGVLAEHRHLTDQKYHSCAL